MDRRMLARAPCRRYVFLPALLLPLLFVVAGALTAGGAGWEPAPWEGYDRYLIAPLRVHLLQSERYPELQCALADEDVTRIVEKVNRIWAQAGIQFYLESVWREPASDAHGLGTPPWQEHLATLRLRPENSLARGMFHVYYVRRLPVNGFYLRTDALFVQDTAGLRRVEGGIDEPIPRVTAHEIGHAFRLSHRQDNTNLMASGTTGVLLNEAEIEQARATAGRLMWIVTPAAALEQAASAGETQKQAIYRCLARIPGRSPIRETALRRLQTGPEADDRSDRS